MGEDLLLVCLSSTLRHMPFTVVSKAASQLVRVFEGRKAAERNSIILQVIKDGIVFRKR